ncbi:exodeoxyribonuclease [Bifidobacterium aemilianum]|uniref:Exodeoxyribonuclease n=1 Tax=Bifidobacterium aemilianum TaxID=2493120 RepID=A0A366K8S1_9BIFI|nr:exodeoxyribonuclease III [Bifidobacterium aemilianum]RBP98140.1 exodeoxyribonuclease [Bifidobacterium aemilianum]
MTTSLISWNIDSLNAALTGKSDRSALTRDLLGSLAARQPDILAIQETKLPADTGKVDKLLKAIGDLFPGYAIVHRDSAPPARKGYAGTMNLYKQSLPEPKVTYPQIQAPDSMDAEGRIITLEFPDFFVTTVYTPNAGSELNRLPDRGQWDDRYRAYLQELNSHKPVLACGDFNVAHKEIDLANPQSNHFSAGFTDQEREKFGLLLKAGFVDSFRQLHADASGFDDQGHSIYTWFAQRVPTSKANNSGWRIDYWLVSRTWADRIVDSQPIDSGQRLDHLPISLTMDI